ncbi:MAG TPA: response regulator transcription factor [Anaerolineae bacterium]|nr:response regulator transcription factor [Anaerolineae bacterium]
MSKIRVLLADDHTILREGIRALLAAQPDIEVVGEAANGREAVARARELQPDVVLMDIAMPLLNGLEATRRIKKEHPEIGVLVLTMHDSQEYVSQILRAGASGYVIKEAAAEDLVSAIRAVHGGGAFLHPSVARMLVDDYLRRVEAKEEGGGYEGLTDREREIFQLIAEGHTNREIADLLCLSVKTVQTHRAHIMEKLDLHDKGELIKYAIRQGIIELS